MNNIKSTLEKYKISLDINKDQFFLIDESVPRKMVETAGISDEDVVLEIGPGLGMLTRELAAKAKEVLAIEIDMTFKPILDEMPENVTVIYDDAYRFLNDKSKRKNYESPTKTVSSIPYSQAQNMLHNYTNSEWYQGDIVWLAPASLAEKINKEPILGAYFNAEVIETVPKDAFYPQPNTTSAIIYFKRIADPIETGNFEIYFRRWLYNHEEWKVKNAIREGLIKAGHDLKGVRVTKNQARELIDKLGVPNKELEKPTNNTRPEYYFEIPKQLNGWFDRL